MLILACLIAVSVPLTNLIATLVESTNDKEE